MKLQFKHQQFQIDAVNSIVDIFEGQPKKILLHTWLIPVEQVQIRLNLIQN